MTELPAADEDNSTFEAPPDPDSITYVRPDTRAALLACIFALMLFYTLYFAAEIVIPLIFALLLKQLLQPGYRMLTRARVPQPIAALAAILILFGLLGAVGFILSAPAAEWLAKAPESLPRLEQHASVLREPIQRWRRLIEQRAVPDQWSEQPFSLNPPGPAGGNRHRSPGIVPHDLASLHYKLHSFKLGDIGERIARHGDEVSVFPLLD